MSAYKFIHKSVKHKNKVNCGSNTTHKVVASVSNDEVLHSLTASVISETFPTKLKWNTRLAPSMGFTIYHQQHYSTSCLAVSVGQSRAEVSLLQYFCHRSRDDMFNAHAIQRCYASHASTLYPVLIQNVESMLCTTIYKCYCSQSSTFNQLFSSY